MLTLNVCPSLIAHTRRRQFRSGHFPRARPFAISITTDPHAGQRTT